MIRFATSILLLSTLAISAAAEDRRFMVSGFDRIRVEGPFEVIVESGRSPNVVASGDALSLDRVSVRVDGRTLVIAPGVNGWGGFPDSVKVLPVIRVAVPDMRSAYVIGGGRLAIDRMTGQRVDVGVSGAGRLRIADLRADRFEGALVGSGSLRVAGQALQARFRADGGGEIDAAGLRARALTVTAQGSGNGRYAAVATAEVVADGQGSVDIAGTPVCKVRGTAPVRCGGQEGLR